MAAARGCDTFKLGARPPPNQFLPSRFRDFAILGPVPAPSAASDCHQQNLPMKWTQRLGTTLLVLGTAWGLESPNLLAQTWPAGTFIIEAEDFNYETGQTRPQAGREVDSQKSANHGNSSSASHSRAAWALMAFAVIFEQGAGNAFIYFQF